MLQTIIFILLIFNSFTFLMMNHPLSMGFILMIQTILIALFTGYFTYSFWFSYSLFLIFMGGMLILFMYMTSLASNEMFNFFLNWKIIIFFSLMILFMSIVILNFDFKNFMMNNKIINNDLVSMNFLNMTADKNNFLLMKMYNFPINMITILLVNYLFLTLIATVKITNIFKGPLRPMNMNG